MMKVNVCLRSTTVLFEAEGVYENGVIIVRKGFKIQSTLVAHIVGGNKSKKLRTKKSVIDETGLVLVDCVFTSPSTAAQFVTGRCTNGYVACKIDTNISLDKYFGREKSK